MFINAKDGRMANLHQAQFLAVEEFKGKCAIVAYFNGYSLPIVLQEFKHRDNADQALEEILDCLSERTPIHSEMLAERAHSLEGIQE
jgi:hypothetical protein